MNIQIPQIVGNVVNVIAKFNSSKDSGMFLGEIKVPAIKLVLYYIAQVNLFIKKVLKMYKMLLQSTCTFFYIYLLSNIGEKMAYQMKADLFSAILKQDIAFFDQHRTGEVINRSSISTNRL